MRRRSISRAPAGTRIWQKGTVLAALLCAAAAAQPEGPVSTIALSDIRPGLRGYGLTVFRGTRPQRFEVEVIDVLRNFRPDQSLILVRTEHPILERAKVVGGMSGSPIFFNGRLAGAYAYGWPFGEEAVAGVTPIKNMLRELNRPTQSLTSRLRLTGSRETAAPPRARPSASRLAGLPPYLGDRPLSAVDPLRAYRAAKLPYHPRGLTPAITPLMVGGLSADIAAELDRDLSPLGLSVQSGGGGGPSTPPANAPRTYEPGSAIGVQLIRGDISATAVGTVTVLRDEKLAAFGHPMMNAGEPGLPTAVARVLHILASQSRSFKISEPVRRLGTMVHDRQAAIVVDTERAAADIPFTVRVHGVPGAPRTEWNMWVASHRVLTPVLVRTALSQALRATASDNADVVFDAATRIEVAGRAAPLSLRERGVSRTGVATAAAINQLRLFRLLGAVYGNPFEEAHVERVEVDLHVRFARDIVTIVDASVAQEEVDPGSTLMVRVVTRHYDESEDVRLIQIPVEEHLSGQTLTIRLTGGGAVTPALSRPRNLDETLRNVMRRFPRNALVASVELPSRTLRLRGHVARSLPMSALDALSPHQTAQSAGLLRAYRRHQVPMDAIVQGSATLRVKVRDTSASQATSR